MQLKDDDILALANIGLEALNAAYSIKSMGHTSLAGHCSYLQGSGGIVYNMLLGLNGSAGHLSEMNRQIDEHKHIRDQWVEEAFTGGVT